MMKQPMRAFFAVPAVLALILAGCGGDSEDTGTAGEDATADEEPTGEDAQATDGGADEAPVELEGSITIGVIAPTQGGFAEIGGNIVEGAELAAEHINADGGVDGMEVVIEVRDEGMQPELATQAVRDFVNSDVDLLAGFLSSVDCNAAAPLVDELGAVLMISTCAADPLTGTVEGRESDYDRVFAVSTRDSMQAPALGIAVAQDFPDVEQLSVFGYDYIVGHELYEKFAEAYEAAGVDFEVAQEFWVPLGEQNFRPQAQAMVRGVGAEPEVSGLILATFGAGTAAVLQQGAALGVADQFAFIAQSGGYYPVARSLDGTAPEVYNAYEYHWDAFDTDLNRRFVDDFQAAHNRMPVTWSYQGYNSIRALAAAIDQADSTAADDVVDALKTGGVEFESPSGTRTIDGTTHQADTPVLVSHTIGNSEATEGVELLSSTTIEQEDALAVLE